MFKIIFPEQNGQRYWDIHYTYLWQIFKYLQCNIEFEHRSECIVTINGKDVLFDYWDTSEPQATDLTNFKFHCIDSDKSIPFAPVSFYDWNKYYSLLSSVNYMAEGIRFSNRQVPYGNAVERRDTVRAILHSIASRNNLIVEHNQIPEIDYLLDVNKIKAAIFVPGFCNNMLDRGHIKHIALGCCTISPHIPEILPYFKTIEDGIHYIKCKDDYSDLEHIITNLNEDECLNIGRNAKQLFLETCTPVALGNWIKECL